MSSPANDSRYRGYRKIAFSSSTLQMSPSPQSFPDAWSKCSHTVSKSTNEIDVLHSIWWSLFDLRSTARSAWKVLHPDWTLPHPAITLLPWLKLPLQSRSAVFPHRKNYCHFLKPSALSPMDCLLRFSQVLPFLLQL